VFRHKWQRHWPWAALCLLFLVYRFAWINGTGLWLDEGNSYGVSRSLSAAMRDRNGAAYFVLLHVWKVLFGGGEFALRSLSVAVDALGFVLFVFICREMALSRRATILAALLYILMPANVVTAQNVRQYVLWNLLQLALWWTVWRSVVARTKSEAVSLWILCQLLFFLSLESHRYTGIYVLGLLLAVCVTTKWDKKLATLFLPWIPITIFSSRYFTAKPVSLDFVIQTATPLYREWGPLFPLGALIIDPRWNYLLMHPGFHAAVGALAFAFWAFGIHRHCRKGHLKESVWLVCMLLPLFILTVLPMRSYPRLLQPMVPVFCIGFAIAFASFLEEKRAAFRRIAICFGVIVAAAFLQTGYKIKRRVLQDFRAAVGNLVDTQPPDTLMITVPQYAYAAARYYAGDHRLLMGFSGTPQDTLSLAGTLPAFEFVELIVLTGHRDAVSNATLDEIGQTHIPTEHWEFAGVVVDRFKRRANLPTVPKSEACKNWRDGCYYWESWLPPEP